MITPGSARASLESSHPSTGGQSHEPGTDEISLVATVNRTRLADMNKWHRRAREAGSRHLAFFYGLRTAQDMRLTTL